MKTLKLLAISGIILQIQCSGPAVKTSEFVAVSQVTEGKPVAVMLTAYSTTLIADGKDHTRLRIAVTDSLSREITSAVDTIHLYVTGEGKITTPGGQSLPTGIDTAGLSYGICTLKNGTCNLEFIAGHEPDKVKVEARSTGLWAGSHEIHTLPEGFKMMVPEPEQLPETSKAIDRMIGADISWLPEIEDRGVRFYEDGQEIDAIKLLREHGFNYIRLRIFVNPENEKGYSPGKGFCGLQHTLEMARRVKAAGMKLLLNFHYSDYWADPQQQYQPQAWIGTGFQALEDSVRNYSTRVINALEQQGTPPEMVQVGNEINHGILWPDGHISNPDQLAGLLIAGTEGVLAADPGVPIMMHLALGGQNEEAVFWLDNMLARGVKFDIIGISYYPRWHGTLDDLKSNLTDLASRYHKPVNVVEYSNFKKEVNDIVFNLPGDMGRGTCIWEPLNRWSGLFDQGHQVTGLIKIYDDLGARYLLSK